MCEPHPACTGCASRTRCATISCVPAGIRRTASSSSSSSSLWHAQTAHIVLPQTPLVCRHARHTQNSPHTLDGLHCGSLTHRKRTREGGVSQSVSQPARRQAAALTRWRVGTAAGRASFHPVLLIAHGASICMHWGLSIKLCCPARSLAHRWQPCVSYAFVFDRVIEQACITVVHHGAGVISHRHQLLVATMARQGRLAAPSEGQGGLGQGRADLLCARA
eukprot:COSAG01_NODE_8724_length_2683_cov_3.317337_2_plen_220_part_00